MSSRSRFVLAVLTAAALHALPVHAQPRVSGTVFADAHYQLKGTTSATDSSFFRFRRVQVTVDQDLDTTFAMRVQLEADDNELTSKGKSATFLKQVYLRWKKLSTWGDLAMGLSPTPTWSVAEGFWGYRSLEKTVLDLQGLGSATDMGVALQRAATDAHPLGWHLMLSNGNGQKPENNVGKKFMLSVPYKMGAVTVEGMADFEDDRGTHDRWTAKGFAGWQKDADALGIEVYRRVNANAGAANADVVPFGVSAYGRTKLNERWGAVGRVDWTDPDSNVDNAGYRETYLLGALDATPLPNVHIMPNVLWRIYSGKASAVPDRDSDVALRVTVHWNYK